MRSKHLKTGKYKKSKYMNFKYHLFDLTSHEQKIGYLNKMNYINHKPRWRLWAKIASTEAYNKMLK